MEQLEISRVIRPQTVDLDGNGIKDKESLLDHMISMMVRAGIVSSRQEYLDAIYEREAMVRPIWKFHCYSAWKM
jgi:mannitol/fructose-specific phosphotransferase system IIA component (Ntr-type)